RETPKAVLFGTSTFWEGVSVEGDQLSCVIIDRIPFQSPDDPVYEAKCEAMKQEGEWSWFNDLALPHATMRLKQGVGRLIRTKKDVGIVSILDTRMTGKQYGRRILEALPGMRVVRSLNGMNTLDDVFGPLLSERESGGIPHGEPGVNEEGGNYSFSNSESGMTSWRINTNEIGEWSTK
ncbi:MAG TPA: hypothetical protein EYN91_19240, partial [Candidatus Melainabacteria bacterium]|nr:hypothetical protein [Candidatus Melainabacteria bacterium]